MTKAWNPDKKFFSQSYEDLEVVDSAVLIMPLVFFSTPSDNRFISTLKHIMKSRERGGLTSNVSYVSRYDLFPSDLFGGGVRVTCRDSLGLRLGFTILHFNSDLTPN